MTLLTKTRPSSSPPPSPPPWCSTCNITRFLHVWFLSTMLLAKKVSFFVPYVIVCFHPIAANGIDVIHGCGGQEGGEVGGQQEGGGHQGGGQQ